MRKYFFVAITVIIALIILFFGAIDSGAHDPYAKKIYPVPVDPTLCADGNIYYNITTKKFILCKGTNTPVEVLAGAGSGITSLNTLSAPTQTFAVGTSGTDFTIASVTSTHTFNIPSSSGANRGLLTSADWTTFNNKISSSRSVLTTAPLGGGGDLSADRTLTCTTCEVTTNKNATNGYAGLSSGKISLSQISEVAAVTDLTDYTAKSGSGTNAIGADIVGLATDDYLRWNGSTWINSVVAFSQIAGTVSIAQGGTGNIAPAEDQVLVGNGTTYQLKTLPSCSNGTTDKLLYNSGTNTFTCGADQTSGGGGGITTLNTLIASTQTFSKTDDTNVTLTLTPSGSDHNFALGWIGTLADARVANSLSISDIPNQTSNGFLKTSGGVGTLGVSASITSSDLNITTTTCTNQFVTAISSGGVGTCTTATLASAQFANQGTTTTVLHGNAAGNPTFGAVSLTADVSGDLPFSNLAQASAASKLLGRGDSGAGDFQEITLGTNLSITGTTLNATGGGGGAPTDATYITQTANGTLSAEQALSSLSTGIMRVATTTGVVTSLTDSAGIASNISDESGTGVLTFNNTPTITGPIINNNATLPTAALGKLAVDTDDTKLYYAKDGTTWGEVFVAGLSLVNLASNVTGTLPVANGGTNLTTATDDNTMVGNGTTWQSKAVPDCDDTGGNHLNYDTATNTFTCGTSGGAGGGANTALSNLAAVAINTTLVSDTDLTDDLGTNSIRWKDIWARDISLTGRTINTDADNAVALIDGQFTLTKNDTNTRTFYGQLIKPILNTGGSNTTTTLNVLAVDTTNTATTGVTTNLLNLSYGGSEKFKVGSDGTTTIGSGQGHLNLMDTDGSHFLDITPGSNLTADRVFTITTGDAARTLSMSGNLTTAHDFITSGAFSLTLTQTGTTNVTLPTTGTLATLAGTETLSGKTLTAPRFANGGFIADNNGNELLAFTTTASAVTFVTLANGGVGVNPKFTAGGDTDVGLDFEVVGAGVYRFLASASGAATPRFLEDLDNGSNYTQLAFAANLGANITITFPTVATTLVGTDTTDILTGKTFDTEGTGNVFTAPRRIWIDAAGCNGTTAAPNFDLPTSSAPTASCTGTTTTVGALDFVDASTTGATRTFKLPSTFLSSGNLDINLIWFANSTSTNAVRWQVSTGCVADSEAVSTGPSYNTASASNEAYVGGTVNLRDSSSFTNVNKSNCAADETAWIKVERVGGDAGDTLTATAQLLGVEVIFRVQE